MVICRNTIYSFFISNNGLTKFDLHLMTMSYPKKIVGSTIDNECLFDFPNFRYKKVVVLMGANASGKTSLGRAMFDIFSFIDKKEFTRISEKIADKAKRAFFSVDFVNAGYLIRVDALIDAADSVRSEDLHIAVQKERIRNSDNYETCAARFSKVKLTEKTDYIKELESIDAGNWMFEFTLSPERKKQYQIAKAEKYLEVLKGTLKTLDPRIVDVVKLKESDDSYIIKYKNISVLLHEGELVDKNNILSSGTKEGIGVANIIASVKCGDYGFVYCDEKFSHIHSETEKAFLSVLIECLPTDGQLFFTTHNTDILDMNLPKHSFAFLRRSMNPDNIITCVYASP